MNLRFSGCTHFGLTALALTLVSTSMLIPAESTQAESMNVIEEVVVTARKRQESLQEVPVVVSVLTEDAINTQRIESITDISTIVPGMVATQVTSGTSGFIYLRGVGTGSGNPAFDQAVAINLDGMGINSAQLMSAGMFDLRQIEVLRGPQALFYGKNSPGGVIAIHSNDPGDEFELELTGMYETTAEEMTLRGIISGPLSDTLGARIAFSHSDADAAWITVHNEDRFEQGPAGPIQTAFETDDHLVEDTLFVLGTLLWEPTDNFSAKLKVARTEERQTGPTTANLQKAWCPFGTPQAVIYPLPDVNGCEADDVAISPGINPDLSWSLKDGLHAGKEKGFNNKDTDFGSLALTYEMDNGLTLTSVTGFFKNDDERFAESSFEVASALTTTQLSELDQWSQEFRLASNFDGDVNFTLGAFYEDKEVEQDIDVLGGFNRYAPALLPLVGNGAFFLGRQNPHQEGNSWSVFGQVSWDINEQWTLAVGGRYTEEEKELAMRALVRATPLFGFAEVDWVDLTILDPKQDWNNFSPEVTFSYQHTDDIMFFASYKEGFKSGGYDISYGSFRAYTPALPLDITYNEELVEGFEVGMKSTLADGTLRFNVTAYSYNYEELQLARFDGATISFSIFNGGKASADGLEVEALWATPVAGLTLTANLAFADSKFNEFIAPCWAGQTIALGCDSEPHPVTGNNTGTDKAGDGLPYASDLSATLGLNYDASISANWNLGLSLNAVFTDDYNPIPERPPEEVLQDSYWWINVGVSLYSSDDRWEVFFRGVNLADETYNSGGVAAPGLGNTALTGTNDASGLPDFLTYAVGGRQFNMGVTYRM